jgi:23S rRNA (uridine2552-2'-O)-methyltransferase
MSKKKWEKAREKDHYYQMAKKDKYRSRASYKLLQLDKRFKIIKTGDYVVDLGAAPGGWSQVALKAVGDKGFVLGVDIQRIKPFNQLNFIEIKGDFTKEDTIQDISELLPKKADVILSDASPKLSGIRDIDHFRSIDIAEKVLEIADNLLKKNGNLIIKVFQGEEFENLLKKIKKRFKMTKTTKPPSSKKGSVEMYVVAKGFKLK